MVNNVKVYCRFRPQNHKEKGHKGVVCAETLDEQTVQLIRGVGGPNGGPTTTTTTTTATTPGTGASSGPFTFDRVFDTESSQEEVYNHVGRDLVKQCLDGYHCTCFAYGQTGAGKTHTMMGSRTEESEAGIIPRMVADVFHRINSANANEEFTVKASYVEIYLERIRDLLDSGGGSDNHRQSGSSSSSSRGSTNAGGGFDSKNLKIRHDKKGRGLYIEGVKEAYVTSAEEMIRLVLQGDSARATASTNMNAASSRSHSIFIITVTRKNISSGAARTGKLFVCDLAGSEMVKKTAATGNTLREAKQINKSLSALGNVIKALTEGSSHVPYRDSALTRLLSEALGGNSKTSLLVAASSSSYNFAETLSTLRFGVRAKRIKNRATQNKQLSVSQCRALVQSSKRQVAAYRQSLSSWQDYASALEKLLKENNIALPPHARPSLPTGYAKLEENENEGMNASVPRHEEEARTKKNNPSLTTASAIEARSPMTDRTNVNKALSSSSPDSSHNVEGHSDSPAADAAVKRVEGTLTPENSCGQSRSHSSSSIHTPTASGVAPVSLDLPSCAGNSVSKHETHQDAAFSDDESAGSVNGFSDDEDDSFNGCVDDLSGGDDDFEAFLNFQDAESNDSFVDEDDANTSSFSGSESCADEGQHAASTVGIESAKAAAAAAAVARQEAEFDQLRLQKELTLMTEKFLRTKVAMLEQKQELEQTRTQVADRAASENEDLKAALNGRNEHIAKLQTEMMRLAQQNVKLQETVLRQAELQRDKESELREMEENLRRYVHVNDASAHKVRNSSSRLTSGRVGSLQTPGKQAKAEASYLRQNGQSTTPHFAVSPIIVKPLRGGRGGNVAHSRKPFSLKDIFANIGRKQQLNRNQ